MPLLQAGGEHCSAGFETKTGQKPLFLQCFRWLWTSKCPKTIGFIRFLVVLRRGLWRNLDPIWARRFSIWRHPISIDFMIDKNAKKWVWLQPGAFFASTSTRDFEPTWGQNRRPKIAFWTKSIGNLYDFWKTACVETDRSIPRPPRGPKVAKWAILAPNAKIQKPLKNQWNFAFFGF